MVAPTPASSGLRSFLSREQNQLAALNPGLPLAVHVREADAAVHAVDAARRKHHVLLQNKSEEEVESAVSGPGPLARPRGRPH